MKTTKLLERSALGLVLAIAGFQTRAVAFSVNWATNLFDNTAFTVSPETTLNRPDGLSPGNTGANLTAGWDEFNDTVAYDDQEFADFLGISLSVLKNADVIVTEGNGSFGGLENTQFIFRGEGLEETQTVQFLSPDDSIAEGDIAVDDYLDFFSLSDPILSPGLRVFAFGLFDLQVVNPAASDFSIEILTAVDAPGNPGTINPDAIGTIQQDRQETVPEPGMQGGVLGAGVILVASKLLGHRRKK